VIIIAQNDENLRIIASLLPAHIFKALNIEIPRKIRHQLAALPYLTVNVR
jgi:hypothetical protein